MAGHLLPISAKIPSDRQRLFLLFFVGALVDLVVLGLFNEFSDKVHVASFSTALLAAVVLQLLLKVTIVDQLANHVAEKTLPIVVAAAE